MTNYKIKDMSEDFLLKRLMNVRNITDNPSDFLDPKIWNYRLDPYLLNDMDKAVNKILETIKENKKIMIFGDYDVDWVTSSYLLYSFFREWLNYDKVSIQYPDRKKDGYWLKIYHIDQIIDKWVGLIITVDNWITSVEEAKYAKEKWIDLIITDHHHALERIPEAVAVVNPQVSPNYPFKWLAGVWVAFKLLMAILTKTKYDSQTRNEIFEKYLPVVAIWTVADVVPLLDENRVIVKKWLYIINNEPEKVPESLRWFLKFLNLKKDVDTFHIGFVIGPRINAGGRICSPYDSLKTLLYSGDKQLECLTKIDSINTERKRLQDLAYNKAKQLINCEKKFLCASSDDFHEWIIGIVSGRITEQNNKPSMVLSINPEENKAVGSLRWPEYFNVIEMLQSAEHLLDRFGGHKQAWWLTVKLNNLKHLQSFLEDYCEKIISDSDIEKTIEVDTRVLPHERNTQEIDDIQNLAPFGAWNLEPIFLFEEIVIEKVEKIWKRWKWHIKVHGNFGGKKIISMFWSRGEELERFSSIKLAKVVWKIKKDDFNWWYFVDWVFLDSLSFV